METMISIARDFLENRPATSFDKIFEEVKSKLLSKWQEREEYNSLEELLTKKMGELYKLLTVDGNFTRLQNGDWTVQLNVI